MNHRYAVMLHHGLGDVICALPAMWAADRILGRAGQFDVVVKSSIEGDLLCEVPWSGVVRIHRLGGNSKVTRAVRAAKAVLALRAAKPDAFLPVHVASPRLAKMLGRMVAAPVAVYGPHQRKSDDEADVSEVLHKAVQYGRYFVDAGVPIDLSALVFPPTGHSSEQQSPRSRRIVIAPAVGAPAEQHKRWPERSYSELVERIVRLWPSMTVELFASRGERAVLERILSMVSDEAKARASICTPPRPMAAIRELVGAACVVTGCSGASHLAAWARVPIVGIYGPTNPVHTGPFTKELYAVRMGLACSPCYRPGFVSGCGTPVCMTEIEVSEVLAAVASAVEAKAPEPLPVLQTTRSTRPDRCVMGNSVSQQSIWRP